MFAISAPEIGAWHSLCNRWLASSFHLCSKASNDSPSAADRVFSALWPRTNVSPCAEQNASASLSAADLRSVSSDVGSYSNIYVVPFISKGSLRVTTDCSVVSFMSSVCLVVFLFCFSSLSWLSLCLLFDLFTDFLIFMIIRGGSEFASRLLLAAFRRAADIGNVHSPIW